MPRWMVNAVRLDSLSPEEEAVAMRGLRGQVSWVVEVDNELDTHNAALNAARKVAFEHSLAAMPPNDPRATG